MSRVARGALARQEWYLESGHLKRSDRRSGAITTEKPRPGAPALETSLYYFLDRYHWASLR